MKYRAVLFDFDGTLTPSLPLWVQAFRTALATFGITQMSDEEIVKTFFHRDWHEVALELKLPSGEALRQEIHFGLRQAFKHAQLFPEVITLLQTIRTCGVQIALVTSAPRLILDDVLPRLSIEHAFDCIVSADDVKNFKPHPEPIHLALSNLKREPSEAIMVGDSTVDILSGKAAGTTTALFMPEAHRSFHRFDALHATNPDYRFDHHQQLPTILGLTGGNHL
jgi:HAD superfamily hydrolase (TIGR01509 family)